MWGDNLSYGLLDSFMDIKKEDFDLKSIVQKDQLFINSKVFKMLNEKYGKEQVKQFMSDAIDRFKLTLPMKVITKDDCFTEFMALRTLDTKNNVVKKGKVGTKTDYDPKWATPDTIYFSRENTGNKASDYFQQENRMKCSGRNYPSPYEAWASTEQRFRMFEPIWSLKMNKVDRSSLLTSIQMKFYIASQFRPSAAKAIYEYFNAKNIIDFSSGWGDRLCGFFACKQTEYYYGIDPNSATVPVYFKQAKYYNNHNRQSLDKMPEKRVDIINKPAEDAEMPENTFDLGFTSPPYLFVEKYSEEENQSYKRYKDLREWLNGFLFRTLEKGWKSLRQNGVMAINISDVVDGGKVNKICDPMNEFLKTMPNSYYVGMFGYEMSKRPNSLSSELTEPFVEPIWVWRKL